MDQALLAGPAISSRRDVERTNWRTLRRHARECDVLHAHDARAHTLAVMHGAGRPVVVARRVAFPIRTGIASRWKYRRAAHFVAISKCVASVLESGGVPAEKISVVRDAGPSVTALSEGPEAVRARGTVCRDGFRVVSPNFDDPLKCRELAVAACKRAGIPILLSDDLPRDLRSRGRTALPFQVGGSGIGPSLGYVARSPGDRQRSRRHAGSRDQRRDRSAGGERHRRRLLCRDETSKGRRPSTTDGRRGSHESPNRLHEGANGRFDCAGL